jgi:serine/threonine-protein kinase RsbT
MALLYDALADVVCRYLSPVSAHAILKQVVSECGRTPQTFGVADLGVAASKLERAAMLFLDVSKRRSLRTEIDGLAGQAALGAAPPVPKARSVEIRTERDITDARLLARQICLDLHAKSLEIQKVATVVSELARNIVSYTRGGHIEIIPEITATRKALVIRATDQGPGIRNLDEIMSGRYRSKTGLGLGIVGTKRLADRFEIKSDVGGTRIEAEVRL